MLGSNDVPLTVTLLYRTHKIRIERSYENAKYLCNMRKGLLAYGLYSKTPFNFQCSGDLAVLAQMPPSYYSHLLMRHISVSLLILLSLLV